MQLLTSYSLTIAIATYMYILNSPLCVCMCVWERERERERERCYMNNYISYQVLLTEWEYIPGPHYKLLQWSFVKYNKTFPIADLA